MKQFKTESKRILDLMINSIYTNKEIFLRELVSNASDAIDKLKFISLTDGEVKSDFSISIVLDEKNRTITIEDNGIGMTDKDLEKNLGTIAESGTLAFKKDNQNKTEEELIGQFGVGFYSAFMVANKIEVYTKAYKSDVAYLWVSEGAKGYEIKETTKENVGTKIVLYLKPDENEENYSEFLKEYKISSLIKRYSDFIRYPIKMLTHQTKIKEGSKPEKPEYETVEEISTLNSMVPLWKKPKNAVTETDLNAYYKSEFHDYNNPLKSVYAKIEGLVNYDTLLFFPEKAPMDYFSKDYKKGLKLFSNGVMIMDKCEDLLPDYFGFVRGVVDSSDLSLNISREILQQDRQVKQIANGLEKRIITELSKMRDDEREKYEKLFAEFGVSIKFGIYQGFGLNKDKLKDLLMFYSQSNEKLITLKDYVTAMKDDQTEILYASGESYETIKNLPVIEKAKDKGVDVLYFKDGVDEFVARILDEYEGKKFKSVQEMDFSLDTKEEKEDLEKKEKEHKELLDAIKEVLKGEVKEVKLTSNLKTYPVCLTSSGGVSIEMEKVLGSLPNSNNVKAEKVLLISSTHKILDKLSALFIADKEKLEKYVKVLYESARLIEGLSVTDIPLFVSAITEIIE